ncbi:MAG: hypothetical protein K9H58_09870 [Bacteroidales bacterium]|nr:hypothetical protein [Bacteroidales bacterium]
MIRILKLIGKLILFVLISFLLIFYIKYISCPVYDFTAGKPFSGKLFYNPYQNMQSENWRKGNFQIQSRAWGGITSGSGNSNEDIAKLYKSLGYDIIGTSDYQKINRYGENKASYVPVYEHGYGIQKSHQVLIGAKRVMWKDYPIFQTIHQKQHIIHSLRKDNALIYLAHPLLRGGYSLEDMKYLGGYDGIEVMNNYRFSVDHWDEALSAGNYVTILGDDDAHDINNPDEIGHHCTLINTPVVEKENIIHALKEGNAYGARIYRPNHETFEDKVKRIKVIPKLTGFEVIGDTIKVRVDSMASEIRFIGQNGKLLKSVMNVKESFYSINDEDTYIRTEIHFPDQSFFCLNPVCRFDGISPSKMPAAKINYWKTWILRIIGFSSLIFVIINIVIIRKKRRTGKMNRIN